MIGVDEVGRGCWAGPLLVVAARATSDLPPGLKDSKMLSRQQRLKILNKLSICCDFGEGWVKVSEIDSQGLAKGLKLGTARALRNLAAAVDEEIVMDGIVNYLPKKFINRRCLAGADNLIPIVSAASIYAKVTRDLYMQGLVRQYPKYGFEAHVGYGTAAHRRALSIYGPITSVHRMSFNPLRTGLGLKV